MKVWIVTGTGTDVGKTHFTVALLLALRAAGVKACGWKPIESGVPDGEVGPDEQQLVAASAIAPPATLRLRDPLTPSLAARRQNIELPNIDVFCMQMGVAQAAEVLAVELPGGAYSPVWPGVPNAALVRALRQPDPSHTILVARNRLGVLHDLGATVRALMSEGIRPSVLVLMDEREVGLAAETNLEALGEDALFANVPLYRFPFASSESLASHPWMRSLIDALFA
jgi:dethiobiotin synthetase